MKGARKMNEQRLSQQVMWAILIMLLLVGCGTPAATPTSGPLPRDVAEGIEVTFDGNECIVSGPTELSIGEHSFVLKDLSEQNAYLLVSLLHDGKTFQDWLDEQSEPGVFARPSWVEFPSQLGAPKKTNGGEVWTYILRKEGEHFISVGEDLPDSKRLWFCSPLEVIEAPSE
jgi:hypothetical protein